MLRKHSRCCALAFVLFLFLGPIGSSQVRSNLPHKTQIVFLGTGTPLPDPDRAGPSTAIVVNSTAYIVDAGTGLVRRAAAAYDKGIVALRPRDLKLAFLTHLHSDHTLGLPDLMITPWIMGRKEPLELYGPPGTQAMVDHILDAYKIDRAVRTKGLEHSNNTGWKVNVHEIKPGVVFKDANVTVTAFVVRHGSMNAFGYRFSTPDRAIVLSGDTAPTDAIVKNCGECDVLIAEAYTKSSFDLVPPTWQRYRSAFHMSTQELGAIATKAKPRLLILFHRGNAGCDQVGTQECRGAGSEEQMLRETSQAYAGRVVAAHDLDIY
jgi:ribonuclease BN (tRNA processing enzyme)